MRPDIDSPEWKRFVREVGTHGWQWIDPRGGFPYEWRSPQGIYVLEGPAYPSIEPRVREQRRPI